MSCDSKKNGCLRVCATCPWLKVNHGRKHPAGWYSVANIKRLWNAIRRGNAEGIVCHSTDSDSHKYGSTVRVPITVEKKPCAGALLVVGKHIDDINRLAADPSVRDAYRAYAALHDRPFTRIGLGGWVERILFGQVPAVEDRRSEVGLPWDRVAVPQPTEVSSGKVEGSSCVGQREVSRSGVGASAPDT